MPHRAAAAIRHALTEHPDAVVKYVDAIAVESHYLLLEADRTVLFLNPGQRPFVDAIRRGEPDC